MNSKNLIIGLSLAANVALAVALISKSGSASNSPSQEISPEELPIIASTPDPIASPEEPSLEPAVQAITWESVESGDYLTYIANLRSIGCPEETIRDIITADVNKLYEQRWKEIKRENGGDKFEYWKSNAMFGGMNSDLRKKYKEMDEERRGTLRSLLGTNVPRKITDMVAMYNPFESMLSFLPQSKQDAIMEIQQQMSERMMEAAEDGDNLDGSDWQAIQKEQEAELAKLLSEDELLEYNLRMSNSANMLRSELGGFDVSEDEFRDMFALRKEFDDEYGTFGPAEGQDPQEWHKQRTEGEKDLKAAYEEVLGEDRYREYGHEQTLRGSSLRNVAKEFDIPREDIYDVFDATDAAQEAAQVIRSNQNLDEAQRQAALDSIRLETEAQLNRLIGKEATQSYIEKGSRIKNLNRSGSQGTVESTSFVAPAQVIQFSN